MSDKNKNLMTLEQFRKETGWTGFWGRIATWAIYKGLKIDKGYLIQKKYQDLYGPDFSEGVLKEVGVTYDVPEEQLEYIPKEGGFFTVSNHHFGSIDGMILNAIFGPRRPDMKILTTFMLSYIYNLRDNFIPVDNLSSGGSRSITGIRTALQHIADGHPLGLFPAGEVATWQKGKKRTAVKEGKVIEDKPWAENIIKLIKKSGLPVIPVYFDGTNSRLFHWLGRIHPRLRTVRLPLELFNKQGTHVKVRIGQPISAQEIASYSVEDLGKYLRNRTYALEAQCTEAKSASEIEWPSEVAAPVPEETVRAQIASIKDKMVIESGDYQVYLIKAADAPDVMQQLYRLREETFRAIGEGTGTPLDTDPYDEYYHHLILWSIPNQEIVGAYRIGYGNEIMESHGGADGFYTSTLFRYGPDAGKYLPQCLELGRSLIVGKYQKDILPLKLMLSGICIAAVECPTAAYCIGPVSVSNSIPDFYKSLMVHYILKDFKLKTIENFVSPTTPFVPDLLRVNPDELLKGLPADIDAFDRLLASLSDGRYRLPILVKKYINSGARVACFNVDPLFSYSLDGFIVQKLSDFPANTLRSFMRPVSEEMRKAVFLKFYGTEDLPQ